MKRSITSFYTGWLCNVNEEILFFVHFCFRFLDSFEERNEFYFPSWIHLHVVQSSSNSFVLFYIYIYIYVETLVAFFHRTLAQNFLPFCENMEPVLRKSFGGNDDQKEEARDKRSVFACAIVFAFNRCNIDRWNWL